MKREHPKDLTISWLGWREGVAEVAEHYLDREYTDEEIDKITDAVVAYIAETVSATLLMPEEFWCRDSGATEFWEFVAGLAGEL